MERMFDPVRGGASLVAHPWLKQAAKGGTDARTGNRCAAVVCNDGVNWQRDEFQLPVDSWK